ncbi:HAD family hydrolase [Motiliproteus coralliicola]|uniref:HAD family hydrolase n=1 Tax=Motiliproteus coralliicola TaxID=2283196 RepID=A0A369WFQ0_9GAMM|nr:HAD family hydrolase [Motiliproteus coralliicola]RDE19494.1 HAD family hydrolase [Motiliproteus coralliicola]
MAMLNQPVFLFDWGDTLMVDHSRIDPQRFQGKMADWPKVDLVEGARQVLAALSIRAELYLATSAADSSETEIRTEFERQGLDSYLSGYFCRQNLGLGKDSVDYYPSILARLGCEGADVVMVGDSLSKDVEPALASGLTVCWLNPQGLELPPVVDASGRIHELRVLSDLLSLIKPLK